MKRETFDRLVVAANWRELFIDELGWNNPQQPVAFSFTVDDVVYRPVKVAQRSEFNIFACPVETIPNVGTGRKLDKHLRRVSEHYLCIYYTPRGFHHLWACPVDNNQRRELVVVEYQQTSQLEFLFSKMNGLSFPLGSESNILDVCRKVHGQFSLNSERITRSFFSEFKKQHTAFKQFIEGLEAETDRDWYTSVMLNRLMFCYFIQKKGFLNRDTDYLQHKLQTVRQEDGENHFYGFYRNFLLSFFHDGLNSLKKDDAWERRYGRIPYLNGGMFDLHVLEKNHPNIQIPDRAFEQLFRFFDTYNWHLDTRITASGRDINPDVLGYIFEQYINDRASMGAYYTKEDITEYISKNCILPFLFDRMAARHAADFSPRGWVWQQLRNAPKRYIYDAMLQGYSDDWRTRIPSNIAQGLDTGAPDLLLRRADWNAPTSEEYALPTEIWRETIERFQRVDEILRKIEAGEIREINQFITYNLNIRRFTLDLLRSTQDHLFVKHFYRELCRVTILDPTCGSGAFLFAAMGILEPLYEVCLDRMEEYNRENHNLFKEELKEVQGKYRSNQQYFIYKSIILHNLYGVDIMREAIEIAKLRLFLKMVAVVEVNVRVENLGLDPLPDIDFNIRCGNTLVGYATEAEIEKALVEVGDIFAQKEFEERINEGTEMVACTYKRYKEIQMQRDVDIAGLKQAKAVLQEKLASLNDLLNRHAYGIKRAQTYDDWLATHQPLHWIAEFYEIIHDRGGFDVIIGNPPYVEFPNKDVPYSLEHLKTKKSGNLYGCCIERGTMLTHKHSLFGFIIPVAITCSERMDPAIKLLREGADKIYFSNFDDRPGKLFEKLQHLRATIFIACRGDSPSLQIYGTKYNRWYSSCRPQLFDTLHYVDVSEFSPSYVIAKHSYDIECTIRRKMNTKQEEIGHYCLPKSDNKVYYRSAGGGYFLLIKDQKSITYINGKLEDVTAESVIHVKPELSNTALGGVISSNLFYWYYIANTDCRNLTLSNIRNFICPATCLNDVALIENAKRLFEDYEENSTRKETYYKNTKKNVVYFEYHQKLSKPIIDEIDKLLAKHYGFTDEELDFIINYDIKYRMGNELNDE